MSELLSDKRLTEMRKGLDDLRTWHLRSQELGATEPGPPNEALWLADDLLVLLRDHERLRAENERLRGESERLSDESEGLRASSEGLRAESERLRAEYEVWRERLTATRAALGHESDQESDNN